MYRPGFEIWTELGEVRSERTPPPGHPAHHEQKLGEVKDLLRQLPQLRDGDRVIGIQDVVLLRRQAWKVPRWLMRA